MNLERLKEISKIHKALERAHEALETINAYNHLRNDLQAYTHDVALWGLNGDRWKEQMEEENKSDEKPDPKGFGL